MKRSDPLCPNCKKRFTAFRTPCTRNGAPDSALVPLGILLPLSLFVECHDTCPTRRRAHGKTRLEIGIHLAVRLDPELTDTHYNLGSVRYALGDVQAAIRSYRQVIELQPGVPDAGYRLALLMKLTHHHQETARFTTIQRNLLQITETLRAELAEVRAQEQVARTQLAQMERQLHDLQAASVKSSSIGDAELEQLRNECRQLGIMTQAPSLLSIFRDIKKGANTPLTAVLLGEPGTGKELFARAIHRLSPRAGRTFIAVNMAALSPELFESELFGHIKGSFTGATADRRGYFELANRGTIFLDEIGDLRLDHQSKLLRVLQERSFYRVGATTLTTVDVRIVAATNRDLQRGVAEGWFREDLYFRLKGLVFRLPPLRERTGDIPALADALSIEIGVQMAKPAPKLSHEAMRALIEHEWKGNVRELRHCLEQAIALNDSPVLSNESLRLIDDRPGTGGSVKQILPDPASDHAVLHCLRRHGFDMQTTAKGLGWDRSTVTQRLKGLCFQALVESDGDHTKAIHAIAGDPRHLRTVELKLTDYYHHLLSVIEPYASIDQALMDCKRRFKNLPDRHFTSLEALVRKQFRDGTEPRPGLGKRLQSL